ncbi:MAG: hypothetical protein HZC41_14950 [Chloroflexi bacterium]|nr:hypothetical protein [Chloroflexota bacterium]
MTNQAENFQRAMEGFFARPDDTHYILSLFITGATPKSTRAVKNLIAICDRYLQGRYELEVIDIYQQPERAQKEGIIAAPTLIKTLPLPLRRLVGDMSDEDRVLAGLGLRVKTNV